MENTALWATVHLKDGTFRELCSEATLFPIRKYPSKQLSCDCSVLLFSISIVPLFISFSFSQASTFLPLFNILRG